MNHQEIKPWRVPLTFLVGAAPIALCCRYHFGIWPWQDDGRIMEWFETGPSFEVGGALLLLASLVGWLLGLLAHCILEVDRALALLDSPFLIRQIARPLAIGMAIFVVVNPWTGPRELSFRLSAVAFCCFAAVWLIKTLGSTHLMEAGGPANGRVGHSGRSDAAPKLFGRVQQAMPYITFIAFASIFFFPSPWFGWLAVVVVTVAFFGLGRAIKPSYEALSQSSHLPSILYGIALICLIIAGVFARNAIQSTALERDESWGNASIALILALLFFVKGRQAKRNLQNP